MRAGSCRCREAARAPPLVSPLASSPLGGCRTPVQVADRHRLARSQCDAERQELQTEAATQQGARAARRLGAASSTLHGAFSAAIAQLEAEHEAAVRRERRRRSKPSPKARAEGARRELGAGAAALAKARAACLQEAARTCSRLALAALRDDAGAALGRTATTSVFPKSASDVGAKCLRFGGPNDGDCCMLTLAIYGSWMLAPVHARLGAPVVGKASVARQHCFSAGNASCRLLWGFLQVLQAEGAALSQRNGVWTRWWVKPSLINSRYR